MGIFIIGFFASTLGFSYFIYGKKSIEITFMLSGIALMVYPYFVKSIIASIILSVIFAMLPLIIKKYF